jgi:5-methylcytosine-specific restriction endonuclease McrA
MTAILLLNADFRPIRILSLKRALSLLLKDRVDVVDTVPDKLLRSPSTSMAYPSVLRLRHYVQVPDRKATWSRRAVFSRDLYTCQYCGEKLSRDDATLDHIIPVEACRAQGIKASTFGNSCCSCRTCNTRKANRTMRNAGMRFWNRDFEPKTPRVSYLVFSGEVPESWKVYLQV